ncbi:MAG: CoA-binding protein [Gammaproteobacteria bacterium]|nr:CoA-binding protein [Gammaproteobacteria bacterium]
MNNDLPLSFLNPTSIAIIGASKNPAKRGYQAMRQLIRDKFSGHIYPVNPKEDEILDIPAYKSIEALPGPADIALVCTPARTLPGVIKQCGERGIKGAVILAGGFSESSEEGAGYERDMLAAANKYGVRLIGPNTSGAFNLHRQMNLAGISNLQPGGLGLISQSGNMALSITTEAAAGGYLGFSTYVGVGNQVDISFGEYLEYLAADPNTTLPVLYIEGFKDGRKFLDVAREVTPKKPVVVYKAGRTTLGQTSAKSHTGALAGSYEMARDLMRQAGVIVARRSDHVIPLAEALSISPQPKGTRLAILVDGGGHATIAADTLADEAMSRVELAQLSDRTRTRLAGILPPAASLANPVDVAGGTDSNPGVFADCVSVMLEDEGVDAVLIGGLYGGYAMRFDPAMLEVENETSIRLAALQHHHQKPIVVQSLYAPLKPEPLVTLREGGIQVQESMEIAVACITTLISHARHQRRLAAHPPYIVETRPDTGQAIIDKARAENRTSLFEHEAMDLVAAHDIQMPRYQVVRSETDVAAAAAEFADTRVAMKIISQDIIHKSEARGVRLRLRGKDEMTRAYNEILDSAREYNADARIEGVLVAPMAKPGVEIIIGVYRDPVYGPVLMFGLGGTLVEVLKDVSFRAIPLSRADAQEMLEDIKTGEILDGVRGARPVDKDALIDLLLRISGLVHCHPEIEEIDFNPVLATHEGYTIADARVILSVEA